MSVANEIMKLKDGQILYNDVCDRLKKKADVIINSTSGNPAAFTDGADKLPILSLRAGFLPIQNLNGYDNPWPAGGGKNLWSFGDFVVGSNMPFSLPAGTYTTSCVATENVGIRFFYGVGIENSVVATMTNSNNHVATITLPSACIAINTSVNNSGTVTNFQIESGSTATSYAPYSNICPITGWTGVDVSAARKNLYNDTLAQGSIRISDGTTTSNQTRVRTVSGTVLKAGTYTISCSGADKGNALFYTTGDVFVAPLDANAMSVLPYSFTLESETLCRFTFALTDDSDLEPAEVTNIQIQTDYDTYPITWTESGAVCGGYVDLISGELWKTWLSVNSSELTWSYSSTYDLFIAVTSTPGYKKPSYINILSDRYKTVNDALTNMPDLAIRGHETANNIYVKDDSFNHDETTFAASDFQIVYELATPVLVATLNPTYISTFLGNNTIWSDANDSIEIDYPSDTKKYIDQYEGVTDVQINGQSIMQNGVANVPLGTASNPGAVQINTGRGLTVTDGKVQVNPATSAELKAGANGYKPIVPNKHHEAAFYALAKLAGADMASLTGVTVGVYPQAQKTAIQSMLGVSTGAILIENVSGGTPMITGLPNVRYKCGEVSTISITPPASGSCEVIFTSGSTATLLTVPNTVKFPAWFDATDLDSNMIYDIIITDGVYGAVMSWES